MDLKVFGRQFFTACTPSAFTQFSRRWVFWGSSVKLGLAMQALIFTLVSVTWIPSLPFPYEKLEGHYNWNTFTVWYGAVGFIIIDSFAFALGQAVLLLLALHRSSSSKASIQRGTETEPLLGHPAEM
ncbi:hypothetical protein KXW77_009639 [Aspergillus fumigatus]|nr:hypothetical protein KXW77_009639 [Aspergillus fumigatus]